MMLSMFMLAAVLANNRSDAEMLVSKNVMVTLPSAPTVETLALASAGTLTVTVFDIGVPQLLQSLSFAITDTNSVLQKLTNAGTLTYSVTGPMTLFANVYAVPDSSAGTGVYHINVSFAPTVPLPAAGWLLFSGLTGLTAFRRKAQHKHAVVTNSVVQ